MDLLSYIRENNKTHVIFDFDATLFLLILPWSHCFEGLKRELIKIDASIWDEYERKELNIAQMQNKFVKNHGQAVRDFINEHTAEFEVEKLQGVDENTDFIEAVKSLTHVKKYIWSSNARPVLEKVLTENGLIDVFERIVSRQDIEFIKPNPEGFALMWDGKTPKSNYLMVGDSTHDREASEAAGIDFYQTDFFDLE